jgi:hypothetical protein
VFGLLALGTVPGQPFPIFEYAYRQSQHRTGWLLVILSFVILASGAAVSVWRHRPADAAEAPLDIVEPS